MTETSESTIWKWVKNEWLVATIILSGVGIFLSFVVLPIQQIRLEIVAINEQLKQITSYEPRIKTLEAEQRTQDTKITTLEATCVKK